MEKDLVNLLRKGPLRHILDEAYQKAGRDVVNDMYLHDFVRMVYQTSSPQDEVEYQV